MESSVNTDLMRSRVDVFILGSLYEKDGYGYDILNYIYSKTNGHYEMKQSSIYSVLKRLEKQGYVLSYLGEESNGGQRRYYSLTDKGREFLDNEQKEWAYTRTLLDNLVCDKEFNLTTDTPPFKASDLRPMTKRTKLSKDGEIEYTDDRDETDDAEYSSEKTVDRLNTDVTEVNVNQSVQQTKSDNPKQDNFTAPTDDYGYIDNSQAEPMQESMQDFAPQPRSAEVQTEFKEEQIPFVRNNAYYNAAQNPAQTRFVPLNPISDMRNAEYNYHKSEQEKPFSMARQADESVPVYFGAKKPNLPNTDNVVKPSTVAQQPLPSASASGYAENIAGAYRKVLADTVLGNRKIESGKVYDSAPSVFKSESEVNNYKSVFSEIYNKPEERLNESKAAANPENSDYMHINDLKNKLQNEGYNLRTYKKAEGYKQQSQSRMIFCTRIIRDTSILTYLFLVLSLLIIYRLESVFGYSGMTLFIIGLSGLIIPVAGLLYNMASPKKKIKSNFNPRLSYAYAIALSILVYVVDLLICLLSPNISYTIKDAQLYPPCIIGLSFIFSVFSYQVLLNSKRYNTKA